MEDRLNVALLVVDALRADHVSCYGYSRPTTPNLDAFASANTRYTTVVSPGVWTFPSMASMFTGVYPSRHGLNRANRTVPPERWLLAERLRDEGYRTAGFSANPYVGRTYEFDRGFEVFQEFWGVSGNGDRSGVSGALNGAYQWLFPRVRGTLKRSQTLTRAYQRYLRRRVEARDKGAAALSDATVEWIDQARRDGRPFFLYAHIMEAHGPLAPPSRHLLRFMDEPSIARAREVNQDAMAYMAGANPLDDERMNLLLDLYDGSVSYSDEMLGRLLDALGDDGVVIVTADHGNSFGEHGILDHFFSVHETLASVPLAVRHPGIAAGVVERPVGTIDIAPTILELAGLDATGLDGVPLTAGDDPRSCLVTEFLDPPLERFNRFHRFDPAPFRRDLRGLVHDGRKYIWSSDGRDELYDLRTDPRETMNLVDSDPSLLAELRKLHDAWLDETSATATGTRAAPDDFEVEEGVAASLRALGYFDD
ncbi:MAG TPA: sulfatase [Actinomycetes bacterium]|nr:sulfatase [Actinomycetes bacterium]